MARELEQRRDPVPGEVALAGGVAIAVVTVTAVAVQEGDDVGLHGGFVLGMVGHQIVKCPQCHCSMR